MKESITIPLATSRKSHRFIFLFLMIVNLGVWGIYFYAQQEWNWNRLVSIVGLLISVIAIMFTYKRNVKLSSANILLLIVSLCWIAVQEYLLGFLMLMNAVLAWYFLKPKNIVLNEEGIGLPGLGREFAWENITNFVVRHQVLTIETDQNHFLQYDLPSETQEEELREFAGRKMNDTKVTV